MATQRKQARRQRAYNRFKVKTGPAKSDKDSSQTEAHSAYLARKEAELASLKKSLHL